MQEPAAVKFPLVFRDDPPHRCGALALNPLGEPSSSPKKLAVPFTPPGGPGWCGLPPTAERGQAVVGGRSNFCLVVAWHPPRCRRQPCVLHLTPCRWGRVCPGGGGAGVSAGRQGASPLLGDLPVRQWPPAAGSYGVVRLGVALLGLRSYMRLRYTPLPTGVNALWQDLSGNRTSALTSGYGVISPGSCCCAPTRGSAGVAIHAA